MPESPENTPKLYTTLGNLRDALGNTSQVTTYCLDLKASSDRFLPLIALSLCQLHMAIEQTLPLLPTEDREEGEDDA